MKQPTKFAIDVRKFATAEEKVYGVGVIGLIMPLLSVGFVAKGAALNGSVNKQTVADLHHSMSQAMMRFNINFVSVSPCVKGFYLESCDEVTMRQGGYEVILDPTDWEQVYQIMDRVLLIKKHFQLPSQFPFTMANGVKVNRTPEGVIDMDMSGVLQEAQKEIHRRLALEKGE